MIALLNGMLHGVGSWFGYDGLSFQKLLGWVFSPLAWLLGVPSSEANQAATYIGEKTVLNEFVAYTDFGPHVKSLSKITVVIVTFALAGFANFSSIAIQIGTIGSLVPERRAEVARARPAGAARRDPGQPGKRRDRRDGGRALSAARQLRRSMPYASIRKQPREGRS